MLVVPLRWKFIFVVIYAVNMSSSLDIKFYAVQNYLSLLIPSRISVTFNGY